jgi:hypothetical protein
MRKIYPHRRYVLEIESDVGEHRKIYPHHCYVLEIESDAGEHRYRVGHNVARLLHDPVRQLTRASWSVGHLAGHKYPAVDPSAAGLNGPTGLGPP